MLTIPLLDSGVNDDFSYTQSAFDFARTGHVLYNGWSTAMLGWQLVWGAGFVKLFGASFNAIRLSMLPISMGSVYLLYQVLVRFGVNSWNAAIGALTMGLSPMFIALSTSFMSDVPAVFCIIVCLYMCQRAIQAGSDRATLLWLLSATVVNLAGGTVRQIAWFGALAMVPATAWLLRRRRYVLPATMMAWGGSVCCIAWCLRWFHQQPYSIVQRVWSSPLTPMLLLECGIAMLFFFLNLLMFMMPLMVSLIPAAFSRPRFYRSGSFMLAGVLAAALLLWQAHNPAGPPMAPWLLNVISIRGMHATREVSPLPLVMSKWVWLCLTDALLLCLASCWVVVRGSRASDCRAPVPEAAYGAATLALSFALCYIALLLPWAAYLALYDRYTLPLFPLFIVCFLPYHSQPREARLHWISVIVLALFAFYAVAATHDYFSAHRARLAAAAEVERSGVPRTQIHASMEYDARTQLEAQGYIADPRVAWAPAAHGHSVERHPWPAACPFYYAYLFPAVDAKYVVTTEPLACLKDSGFPPVTYRIWLPPFARTLYVGERMDGAAR
jgi:hypothetical protein